jgi:hypothetical protein
VEVSQNAGQKADWHILCDDPTRRVQDCHGAAIEQTTNQMQEITMMRTQNWLVAAGIGAALCLSASNGLAQNDDGGGGGRRRNFDPAQMQQRMMDRYKELLEVNSDEEWNAMQPMIQKVMDARRETFAGGMGRGMFGGRRGGQGGGEGGGMGGGGGGMRRGPGGEPNPDADALRKAIEAKAGTGEIKAALAKYVASRQAKAEQLKTAQENLRKVLTARQEAIATLNGLL